MQRNEQKEVKKKKKNRDDGNPYAKTEKMKASQFAPAWN